MLVIRLRQRGEVPEKGFPVEVIVDQGSTRLEDFDGYLPPISPQLEASFEQWRQAHRGMEDVCLRISPKPSRTRSSPRERAEYANALKTSLNDWLNSGDSSWQEIKMRLAALSQSCAGQEVRILIDAQDSRLHRFPWQEWRSLIKYYPDAEVAIASRTEVKRSSGGSARILLVVGRTEGIENGTETDVSAIQQLETKGARVTLLRQPSRRELLDALRNQPYEIFIFTGHSGSEPDGQIGWIELNAIDNVRIEELRQALSVAVKNGLQVAIFNSCDGLGLANQAIDLGLPIAIVMREPIPDEVALQFLQDFFQHFTRGESFFAAFRQARVALESFIGQYPGVYWLPTIFMSRSVQPPTWQELGGRRLLSRRRGNDKRWMVVAAIAGALSLVAVSYLVLKDKARFSPAVDPVPTVSIPAGGPWKYSGGGSGLFLKEAAEKWLKQDYPQFNLQYDPNFSGSIRGIKALKESKLDFSFSSDELGASEKAANLDEIAVAKDGVAVAVHPNLSDAVKNLTLQQLKEIYTGKLKNWKDLGGPDLGITAFSYNPNRSGTARYFMKQVLGLERFQGKVLFISGLEGEVAKIAATPGSVGVGSASWLVRQCAVKPLPLINREGKEVAPYQGERVPRDGSCKQKEPNHPNTEAFEDGTYPMVRPIYIIINQNDRTDKAVGEAYAKLLLTAKGQEIVKAAGYARIR